MHLPRCILFHLYFCPFPGCSLFANNILDFRWNKANDCLDKVLLQPRSAVLSLFWKWSYLCLCYLDSAQALFVQWHPSRENCCSCLHAVASIKLFKKIEQVFFCTACVLIESAKYPSICWAVEAFQLIGVPSLCLLLNTHLNFLNVQRAYLKKTQKYSMDLRIYGTYIELMDLNVWSP